MALRWWPAWVSTSFSGNSTRGGRAETETARAGAAEADALRAENETLKRRGAAQPAASDADTRELARLRNEAAWLRKLAAEAESLRAQAAEAGPLRAQLTAAKRDLAVAEEALARTMKITPEDLQGMKKEAQSTSCVNNLKQIGLAANLYASQHGKVFPPDLATLRDQLRSPKILFCPAAEGVPAANWTELNPATISYQLLNPNGNDSDPQKPLTACLIHGHTVLSDASVHRNGL